MARASKHLRFQKMEAGSLVSKAETNYGGYKLRTLIFTQNSALNNRKTNALRHLPVTFSLLTVCIKLMAGHFFPSILDLLLRCWV